MKMVTAVNIVTVGENCDKRDDCARGEVDESGEYGDRCEHGDFGKGSDNCEHLGEALPPPVLSGVPP